jgi:hypothetical protein
VHSSWGTFEWLAEDAFKNGYRVGIVGNSDGHKGRPGSEPPGASLFGALGGLTCYWLPELTRDAVFDALQARHHYGTTGSRVHLTVDAKLPSPANIWIDDPRVPNARKYSGNSVMMGDIVSPAPDRVKIKFAVESKAALLSFEIRRGAEVMEVIRPHGELPLGNRYRIEWSGAEYRGRARQTIWDGSLSVDGAKIVGFTPINFFNPDRQIKRAGDGKLTWSSITTGNFAGVDLMLSGTPGRIEITTPHGVLEADLAGIAHQPMVRDFGKLRRELRISRQPDSYSVNSLAIEREVNLIKGDNPIWVCATFADGHQAWSSPIYFIR